MRKRGSKSNSRSFGFQWHITEICDQKCRHCYSVAEQALGLVERELGLGQCLLVLKRIVSFCKNTGCVPGIGITGGDPLLAGHFWDLAAHFKKEGIMFSLMGNPFHLDRSTCDRLIGMGCRSYQMSLDGLERTHDSIRKKGSFRATIEALELLKSAGIKISIMNTVTMMNSGELIQLVRLAVDLEVDLFGFARYCPTELDMLQMISPTDYRMLLEKVWETYAEISDKNTILSLKDHLFKLLLFEKGLLKPSGKRIVSDGCGCGVRHCAILPDGQVYACRRFPSPVGNLTTSSMEEIFFGGEMAKYREIESLEGCADCELLYQCRGCHATSYGAFGSFFKRDPQCWK